MIRALGMGRTPHAPLDARSVRCQVNLAGNELAVEHRKEPLHLGHFMRVGRAHDMPVAGFEMAAIMQTGLQPPGAGALGVEYFDPGRTLRLLEAD